MLRVGLPVRHHAVLLVSKAADEDDDEINQRPNPESTESEDHQDAGAHLADIEAVDTEDS